MSHTPERWGWVPLGQMLVQDGILTDEQNKKITGMVNADGFWMA